MHRMTNWIPIACVVALAAGCAADLHENEGPLVPFPNVTGRVTVGGAPVADRKVKLIATASDSEVDNDRTDLSGRFEFTQIQAGAWTLEVSGAAVDEFDAVGVDFELADEGARFESPDLDLFLRGLSPLAPAAGDTLPPPSLFQPIEFRWTRPDPSAATIQVRVYGPTGEAVWYSAKTEADRVRWNGIANQGSASGRPVGPGNYRWKLREEPAGAGAVERSTISYTMAFEGVQP